LAHSLRTDPETIIFTSGGTVADNLALKGIARARAAERGANLVAISSVEHHAVFDAAFALANEGFEVRQLAVDASGRVLVDQLKELLAQEADRVALVSVMSANNETGSAQPLAPIAEALADHNIPFHSDAVQSVGWWGLPDAPEAAVSISGHKFGAPIGTGALVLPASLPCEALLHGGGQERRVHSGTLDVAGAASLAAALATALASDRASAEPGWTIDALRTELARAVAEVISDVEVLTPPTQVLPGIVSVLFHGCDADALLMLLDAKGIECSTGSACTAGIPEPSHVVTAMGRSDQEARSVLRFSLGWTSTLDDIGSLCDALPETVERARRAASGGRRRAS